MSKKGLQVALAFGKSLPDFANYEEAKDYYFSFRERHLELLRQISQRQATFVMDFSPESLKSLEKLYFALHESNLFEDLKTTREEFESCMSVYYGETVVRNCSKASWVVVPFGFLPNKFELMVRSTNCGEGIGRFPDHYRSPGNKGHDSLWRRFHQRFWSRELRTDPPEAVSASAVWAQYDPAQAEAL